MRMLRPLMRALPLVLLAAFAAVSPGAAAEEPPAVATEPDPPAAAQGKAPPAADRKKPVGDEIHLSAANVERRPDEGIVVGEGAVEIVTRDLRLVADRVLYHEATHDVVADGHVVLDSGPDRLQGTHLELNLDTRVGFIEEGQGFIQTYYFTGKRIDKVGPDRYFIRDGTFTTCEGTLPDWSFHSTSTAITIDEYLHAWNPSMWVSAAPVFYLPYAVFPIKRDRSTGFLIPEVRFRQLDGMVVRNKFFWAPRDDFDATVGLDWFQKTGWGANGELRYLLGAQSHGEVTGIYTTNPDTDAQRWYVKADLIHELPFKIRGQAQLLIQNDRSAIDTLGSTLEQTSSERTTSSFYLNRSWSAYDFSLTGRSETSLLTAQETTLTRFPSLSIDRTSTRLFDTDLFLKVSMNGVRLGKEVEKTTPSETDPETTITTTTSFETTRLYFSPELSWPISVGSVLRLIPLAGYSYTYYSKDLEDNAARRSLPFYQLGLEGPKVFRVWDLLPGGGVERVKHLIEPRVNYVYTPKEDAQHLPQFDSIDSIAPANRLEYSLTNTLFAKVLPPPVKTEAEGGGGAGPGRDRLRQAQGALGRRGGADAGEAVRRRAGLSDRGVDLGEALPELHPRRRAGHRRGRELQPGRVGVAHAPLDRPRAHVEGQLGGLRRGGRLPERVDHLEGAGPGDLQRRVADDEVDQPGLPRPRPERPAHAAEPGGQDPVQPRRPHLRREPGGGQVPLPVLGRLRRLRQVAGRLRVLDPAFAQGDRDHRQVLTIFAVEVTKIVTFRAQDRASRLPATLMNEDIFINCNRLCAVKVLASNCG